MMERAWVKVLAVVIPLLLLAAKEWANRGQGPVLISPFKMARVAAAIAAHGADLVTEKPMAARLSEARQMVRAADGAGDLLGVDPGFELDWRSNLDRNLVRPRSSPRSVFQLEKPVNSHGDYRDSQVLCQ